MKRRRNLVFTFIAILVFLLGGAIAVVVVGPPGPKIVCHKLLNAGLEQWMMDTTNGVKYPNLGGDSRRSLAPVLPLIRGEADMLRDYGYIPGLNDDDPENLILFYLKEPSRRTWHVSVTPVTS